MAATTATRRCRSWLASAAVMALLCRAFSGPSTTWRPTRREWLASAAWPSPGWPACGSRPGAVLVADSGESSEVRIVPQGVYDTDQPLPTSRWCSAQKPMVAIFRVTVNNAGLFPIHVTSSVRPCPAGCSGRVARPRPRRPHRGDSTTLTARARIRSCWPLPSGQVSSVDALLVTLHRARRERTERVEPGRSAADRLPEAGVTIRALKYSVVVMTRPILQRMSETRLGRRAFFTVVGLGGLGLLLGAASPGRWRRSCRRRAGGSTRSTRPGRPSTRNLAAGGDRRRREPAVAVVGRVPSLPDRRQTTTFHCVTGWTIDDVRWQGLRRCRRCGTRPATAQAKFANFVSHERRTWTR